MEPAGEQKSLLREKYRRLRYDIGDVCRWQLGGEIFSRLVSSKLFDRCDLVLSYVSMGSEVDTWRILRHCHAVDKAIAMPRCIPETREMDFCIISSAYDLTRGNYGIFEPRDHCAIVDVTQAHSSICLVPALAFDRSGYRLGYGGGYYDRFLPHYSGKAVGVCYGATVCEHLPRGEYDCAVQYLLSENGLIEL